MKYCAQIGIFSLLTLQAFLNIDSAAAQAGCQVLDAGRSRISLQVSMLSSNKETGVSNPKAYLWVDPLHPEKAKLSAKALPLISKIFPQGAAGDFLGGLLGTITDQPMSFRSSQVRLVSGNQYEVEGRVEVGGRTYPATFPVRVSQLTQKGSSLRSRVRADDLSEAVGIQGSAEGNFDLVFTASDLSEKQCVV